MRWCPLLALAIFSGCYESHAREAGSSSDAGAGVGLAPDGGDGPLDAGASEGVVRGTIMPICSPRRNLRPAWYVRLSEEPVRCASFDPLTGPIEGSRIELFFYEVLTERSYELQPWPSGEASLTIRYTRGYSDSATAGTVVIERMTPEGEMFVRWSATIESYSTMEGEGWVTMSCPGSERWPAC